jgi:undecaprenyl-diphosphatase
MTLGQVVVHGIVQGLTEFLPISSIAHLKIVAQLLGWSDPGAAFSAVIQLSVLASLLLYFNHDIARITRATISGLVGGRPLDSPDAKMGWMIIVGTVPIIILGLLFHHQIETSLRSLYVIAVAMIGLAIVLMLAEAVEVNRKRSGHKLKELSDLGWFDAVVVGLSQCAALIPGASRSGSTITGGLFLGMTRETAARFSFLLCIPAVAAAGAFELFKAWHELLASQADAFNLFAGTVVSAAVGYLAIAFLLGYLKKHTTWVFIIYRLLLGSFLLALLHAGRLSP